MKITGYFCFLIALSLGFLCVAYTGRVISFYSRFRGGNVKMPTERNVRLAGAVWIILLLIIMYVIFSKTRP
jgi:heme/copper-type cytochrome/quinol oxidase subunit 2